ncbi:MAG: RNA polymerase sigma factor region1.1 domain-containing protein, partial [Rhodoferax sp.]|nr:RNA polymerase sigma factor region1.1 domain-containing protein [Rhodoferax sp.]
MPAQKSKKPVKSAAKPVARVPAKPAPRSAPPKVIAKVATKTAMEKSELRVKTVPASESRTKAPSIEFNKAAAAAEATEVVLKKKPGRPPKAASIKSDATPTTGAKRGRKPKTAATADGMDNSDMADIEADLVGEPVVTGEKVKPLRMKISKAKERALMKEFGLDETVLSEEDIAKRRLRLKALIKLGKTRGYLTHGEISDHLPDKLVDAETLEVVISMLNDMGVAVYEQTPDAETLLLNNNGPTAATEEEAEEEAEAALSTVDSEFGRTTDPVRM